MVAMNADGEASVARDPAAQALSRRAVLGRIIQGLGLSLALGFAISARAKEQALETDETDRLIVRVAR